jgi:hypothetical protein
MSIDGYRWEYGFLARWGDWCWAKIVDPVLRSSIGQDDITSLRRIRAAIQLTVLAATWSADGQMRDAEGRPPTSGLIRIVLQTRKCRLSKILAKVSSSPVSARDSTCCTLVVLRATWIY